MPGQVLDHRHGRGAHHRLAFGRDVTRQEDAEHRPAPHLRFRIDEAAGLLDDAVDGGKTEPRALTELLGRKERLEDLLHDLGRHTGAGVLDLDLHVVGGRHAGIAQPGRFGLGHIARADGDRAAIGHRVARIDHEVHHHLLELHEVGLHRPDALLVIDMERDLLADQPLEQHRQIVDVGRDFEDLRPQRLAAREGKKLPRQSGGPVRALLDRHQIVEARIARLVLEQQEVREADDGREHVVEVVRDAAGELAHGLHLLALRELSLELALVSHVERVEIDAFGRVLALLRAREIQPHRRIALAHKLRVDRLDHGFVRDGRSNRFGKARAARVRQELVHGDAIEGPLAPRPAEDAAERGVGAHDPPVLVKRRNGEGRVVEEAGEPHFGCAKGFVLRGALATVEDQSARLARARHPQAAPPDAAAAPGSRCRCP